MTMSNCARRIDRVLEMTGGEHRLMLPPVGFDREKAAVILRQPVDDEIGPQPLIGHIPGRRDEHPQTLRHVCHSLANFVTNKAHQLQPCRQSLAIAGDLAPI